ncbi:MAG: nuclease-related domain-containing protein [Thermoproteota archaeon]
MPARSVENKPCIRLLKKILEKGFKISAGEASEYKDCLSILINREGVVEEEDMGFKILPEGFMIILQRLIDSGVSLEHVLRSISWRGFEKAIAEVFRFHGFKVYGDFRFSLENVRREIDILVETPSTVLSIDCKHWIKRNYSIPLVCKHQLERSLLLSKFLMGRGVTKKVYPLVVTLLDSETRVLNGCLVLPVWKIGEIARNIESIRMFIEPVS